MTWFKNLFKSQKTLDNELAEKINQAVLRDRMHRDMIEAEILSRHMESIVPWYEPIIGSSPDGKLTDRWRWNPAHISELKKNGFTGNNDEEIFQSWLNFKDGEERNKILAEERERNRASSEPWVEVVAEDFDNEGRIAIKLDWNSAFITYLRKNGFNAHSEEVLVHLWLAALQREAAQGEFE